MPDVTPLEVKMETPKLKFHGKRCNNCRYYRIHPPVTDCLLLGRTLSVCADDPYADMHRVCIGWKKLPSTWNVRTDKNPFWEDKYISRESQKRIRKRVGIEHGNDRETKLHGKKN